MRPRLDALEGYLVDHGADWASRAGDAVSRPFTWLEGYCNRRYWTRRRRNAPPPRPPVGPFATAKHYEIEGWMAAERADIARQLVGQAAMIPFKTPHWWIPVDEAGSESL